jgi:hypothetical protein
LGNALFACCLNSFWDGFMHTAGFEIELETRAGVSFPPAEGQQLPLAAQFLNRLPRRW